MTNFDRINRAVSDYKNNTPISHDTSNGTRKPFNYYNNETYKAHNGQYNNYYNNYRY